MVLAVIHEGQPGRAEHDVGPDLVHEAGGRVGVAHVELNRAGDGDPMMSRNGGVAPAAEHRAEPGGPLSGAAAHQRAPSGPGQPSDSRGEGRPSTMMVSPVMKDEASEARKMQG